VIRLKQWMYTYREELIFLAAEIILMYGVTKLYALLYRPLSWASENAMYIPPIAAFLCTGVFCFKRRGWVYPICITALLSLTVGCVFWEPPTGYGMELSLLQYIQFGAYFYGFLNFLAAVPAAILGNLAGFAADKITEKRQEREK